MPGPAGSPFSLGAPGLGFRARGAGAARRGRGDRERSGSRPGGRSCVSPASPGTGAGLERRTGPARDAAPWRSLLARRRVFNGTVPLASLPPRRSTGPAHLRSGPGAGVRRVLPILGAKPQRGGSWQPPEPPGAPRDTEVTGEAERGVGVQPPIPRYLPEGWHSPEVFPGWAVLPQVCFLQPRGADSSAEGLTCAWPGCTGNSGICAVEGSSVPSVPPGRSEASFSNPQLIPCTTTFLHGAAPLSPQPALLSLDAAFWDGIWYFQCYFPPSLPFPWVLFVLLAVSLGLWGGFLLPVGL